MKDTNPPDENLPFANVVRRLIALLVLILFGYLIWLAYTGKYDMRINQIAAWLHRHVEALRRH